MNRRNTTLSLAFLTIMAALTLTSCGSTDQPTGPSGDVGTPPPNGVVGRTRIVEAYNIPRFTRENAESSVALCVHAVFTASIETGGSRLVTTGTLTQTAPNSDRLVYAATPTDRLRIRLADGSVTEFVVSDFDGDFSGDADDFLRRDHRLDFTVHRDGIASGRVTSNRINRRAERTVRGTMISQGISYDIDLAINESTFFDIVVSAEFKSETKMTGVVSAPGLSIAVDETDFYHSFTSDDVSEDLQRRINTSWTSGSERYAFVDGRISKALRNDIPVEVDDFWNASGTITLDGTAAGRLSFTIAGNRMKIQAQMKNEQTELGVF